MTDGKGKSIVVVEINRQTAKAQISKGICVFFCFTDLNDSCRQEVWAFRCGYHAKR